MTRIDKNYSKTPTGVGKTTQQKRHLLQDALKNGGAVVRDEITSPVRVRRKSLFIRQLAGNYRKKSLVFGFCSICTAKSFVADILGISRKFPKTINREKRGPNREETDA